MNAEQQERMDTERQDRIITECDKYSDRMRHRMIETFSTDEMEEMLGGLQTCDSFQGQFVGFVGSHGCFQILIPWLPERRTIFPPNWNYAARSISSPRSSGIPSNTTLAR